MEQSYPIPLQFANLLETFLEKSVTTFSLNHFALPKVVKHKHSRGWQKWRKQRTLQGALQPDKLENDRTHDESTPLLKSTWSTEIVILLGMIDNYGSNQTRTNELSNNSWILTWPEHSWRFDTARHWQWHLCRSKAEEDGEHMGMLRLEQIGAVCQGKQA